MERKLAGWAASSQNPEQVANKVKGVVLAASSVIIFFVAQLFNITLTAESIVELGTALGGLAGALWSAYGVLLHLITWFATVRQ